jgi:hypothetical protein
MLSELKFPSICGIAQKYQLAIGHCIDGQFQVQGPQRQGPEAIAVRMTMLEAMRLPQVLFVNTWSVILRAMGWLAMLRAVLVL